LVNNAGASFRGFDADLAAKTLDNNYRGAVRVTDALAHLLAADANIVIVSSGMGERSNFSAALQQRLLAAALTREQIAEIADEFVDAVARGTHAAAGFPSNRRFESIAECIHARASPRICEAAVAASTPSVGAGSKRAWAEAPHRAAWQRAQAASSGRRLSKKRVTRKPSASPNGGFFRDGKPIAW